MKTKLFSFLLLLFPAITWGGRPPSPSAQPGAPTLDEGGLVMLALVLAGTGLTLLRRNKR